MFVADEIIFLAGLLLTLSIVATVPADRSGVPVLVVFLVIGMVAGVDGVGGVDFQDVGLAHFLGTVALAVILFDGGLHTPLASFRTGLAPGLVLATVGVAGTAAVAAGVMVFVLGLDWPQALLLAAMVSSTDAAAVFYLLRARGIELHPRVRNTLEIESGINDPLAIFMTLVMIQWIGLEAHTGSPAWGFAGMFVVQVIAGAGVGYAGGVMLTALVNRLRLAASLYPLLALAGGLFVYGAAAVVGGSGFLAVYLAGLIVGNRARSARRGIQRFHDGMAWLCQIGLFLMLGLLVTPTELVPFAGQAAVAAVALVLVARPVAVAVCLAPLRFTWNQVLFVSWVGLRGAVPIVLSLYPLLAGVRFGWEAFNIIFFLVLISLTVQGWTVSPMARWLGLLLPRTRPDATRIDLDRPSDHELVACELPPDSPATRGRVADLNPPDGVRLISLVRREDPRPPAPDLLVQPGDVLYLVVPTGDSRVQGRFDRWLDTVGTAHPVEEQAYFGEFTVDASAPMAEFAGIYLPQVLAEIQAGDTVGGFLRRKLRHRASEGDRVRLHGVVLVVREMDGDRVTQVGVRLPREGDAEADR